MKSLGDENEVRQVDGLENLVEVSNFESNRISDELKTIKVCLLVLLLLYFIVLMYFARPVIFPIVFATFLNLILSPPVRYLKRFKVPNAVGALVLISTFFMLFSLGIVKLIDPAKDWIERAPSSIVKVEKKFHHIKESFRELSKAGNSIAMVAEMEPKKSTQILVRETNKVGSFLSITGSSIGELLAGLFLAYFFLASGDKFLSKAVEIMPKLSEKKRVVEIMRSIEENISNYLISVTSINLVLGILVGLAMWAVNMPNPALWGVMACLFNFVPYLGSLLGIAVIVVVSLVSFDSVFLMILPPMLYLIIDTIEGSFITPYIVGLRLNLNPAVMIMWILIWGWIWGPWGGILAVPMLTSIKIFSDHVDSLSPLSKFLEI